MSGFYVGCSCHKTRFWRLANITNTALHGYWLRFTRLDGDPRYSNMAWGGLRDSLQQYEGAPARGGQAVIRPIGAPYDHNSVSAGRGNDLERLRNSYHVNMARVSGHSGGRANEATDGLARRGTDIDFGRRNPQ